MPRRSKGARLHLKAARRDKAGKITHRATWIIRDNGLDISTGCASDEITAAEQALKDYIASKYAPKRKAQDIESIPIGDVLSIYLDAELAKLRDRFKVAEDDEETIPGIRKFKADWAPERLVGRKNASRGRR
ncbi:hypothetical protein ACVIW2_004513 [Bradyrhizobium huanghuaihaiense]|jgi:hypothetical protein|uniref:Bll1585 protein n=3 Tax=Bradyrhizobium TaxID=374 RepID=Q89U34_BRADU|nr:MULTISPECIES: hypothetical protein [Bradyrhizobium]APO50210.1 phage integrase [Bradyrhizobium diazoefficiens]MBP1089569.1 hypothetical protein [Bradyrhizobium japonicum]MCD9297378.1 hypothetical protein [Bradyrhizobium diazoefficiens]MCD9814746.1 hypothetical protein [Bradyrhizobium diazoefficiens]MCD9832871.1 hypothetical protein [Bradyrhizobium diazoefficiens]